MDTNDASIANTLNAEGKDGDAVPRYEAKSGDAGFAAFRQKAQAKSAGVRSVATADTEKAEAEAFSVGQRVVTAKTGAAGTIRYLGPIESLPAGYWVGLELDAATGKNDGEVKGVRLFTCEANKGAILRPSAVLAVEEGGHKDEEEL